MPRRIGYYRVMRTMRIVGVKNIVGAIYSGSAMIANFARSGTMKYKPNKHSHTSVAERKTPSSTHLLRTGINGDRGKRRQMWAVGQRNI